MPSLRPRSVTPVDAIIAARVRARRLALGLSEREVARAIGATVQQMRAYEACRDRIPSSVVMRLGQALKCDPVSLLPCADPAPGGPKPVSKARMSEELLDAFERIDGTRERKFVLELARRLAGEGKAGRPVSTKRWARLSW